MIRPTDIPDLRLIAQGAAFSAEVEEDMEERGLIRVTDKPYPTITAKGLRLLAEADKRP